MAKKSKPRRVTLGIPQDENGLQMCHIRHKAKQRLIEAFIAVIHELCDRKKGFVHDHDKQLFPVGYILKEVGLFEPHVPDKLRELWEAIDEAVEDAFSNGQERGASLLQQLASGAASIDQFNELAIGRTQPEE